MNHYLPYELPVQGRCIPHGQGLVPTIQPKSADSFPSKLYRLLSLAEFEGLDHIISWVPHGRAFRVHDRTLFREELMPCLHNGTSFGSFERHLGRFGFRKIEGGPDLGAYFALNFLRGAPLLAQSMKEGESAPPAKAPDFYRSMPWMPPCDCTGSVLGSNLVTKIKLLEGPSKGDAEATPHPVTQDDVTVTVSESEPSADMVEEDPSLIAEQFIKGLKEKYGGHMAVQQLYNAMKADAQACAAAIDEIDNYISVAQRIAKEYQAGTPDDDPVVIDLDEKTKDYEATTTATVVDETSDANATTTTGWDGSEIIDFFDEMQYRLDGNSFDDYSEEAEARLFVEMENMFHQDDSDVFSTEGLSQEDASEAAMIRAFLRK